MTDPIAAIEDNYTSYFQDSAGFSYDAWDRLTQVELARVDAIERREIDVTPGELTEDPLFEWFKARVMYQAAEHDAFLDHVDAILASDSAYTNKLLVLTEVAEMAMDVAIAQNQTSRLDAMLNTLETKLINGATNTSAIPPRVMFLKGALAMMRDTQDDSALLAWVKQDSAPAEACVDIAQLMFRHERWTLCERWLARADVHAADEAQRAARVDVELMREAMAQKNLEHDAPGFAEKEEE